MEIVDQKCACVHDTNITERYKQLAHRIDVLEKQFKVFVVEKGGDECDNKSRTADLLSPARFSNNNGMSNGTEDMFEKMTKRKAALNSAQSPPVSCNRAKRIVEFAKKYSETKSCVTSEH